MILNEEILDEDDKINFIKNITVATNKLDSVIHDLNDILTLREKTTDSFQLVGFSEIVSEIKSGLNGTMETENITIFEDFSECPELFSNKNYLTSIFHNLISNSIKYREKNMPSVITITSHKKNNFVKLVFKDNGIGIDMEKHKDLVFGLYKRINHDIEGKGMGLYLVKTQVESLGGKIQLHSEINKGCEFTLKFNIINHV